MRKISNYLCFIAVFAMLFTSCSKEEENLSPNGTDKATLSFGAILNDLTNQASTKQSTTDDLPECTDGAVPAFVDIALYRGGQSVVGTTEDPFRIDLVEGQVFTEEIPELELEPGNYSLEHFMVYDANGNLLWVAPRGGVLAQFIDNPLPLSIDLGAGVKKYVDVSVICYDDREIIEYGYQFFEFDTNEAIEFCVFGNYCPPSGRHYPARFSVDVWMWNDGARGTQIHNDVSNTVAVNDDGDWAASPACLALPDLEGEDEYYVEITLLNSDAYPSQIEERIIRRGVVTDAEVRSFFDGDDNLDYYHFREGEGCGDDNAPIFEDPEEDAVNYKACLYPQDSSMGLAFAYFKVQGDVVETKVMAMNLGNGVEYSQFVYENDDCSNPGDAILDLDYADGTWPSSTSNGYFYYERTFTEVSSTLDPLESRTVGLHTADGMISCGEVELIHLD